VNENDLDQFSPALQKTHLNGSQVKQMRCAGGSGITPMLQIIDAVVKDEKDTTEVCSLYLSQSCMLPGAVMMDTTG
jgi:ferredoxin-NADP reductase